MSDTHHAKQSSIIEVLAAELEGPGVVSCPHPSQALWNQHPKVYINVAKNGEGKCPYCGTVYRLKAGEHLSHGH